MIKLADNMKKKIDNSKKKDGNYFIKEIVQPENKVCKPSVFGTGETGNRV